MFGIRSIDNNYSSLSDFYYGKSVFITGAAGFVGTVLLETLLRCFPEIKFIYILLRSKRNVQPEVRKQEIFNRKIFENLREETPELLKKVRVIAGDISLPKLGMKDEDIKLLVDEVSVVFHCAAIINFTRPLRFTLMNNVFSVRSVIEFCRQMKKFEALVYTSTAACTSNLWNLPVKEEIHRLPVRAEKFIHALINEDSEMLQELMTRCKPDWPNFYTFSKCLAENVINDTASDLPVAIIRPSLIINTWKNPMPGYVEGFSGLTALSLGAGKGFIKVVHADPHITSDAVPADIVANTHVLAAWSVGTKRCASPLVVNCTATENLRIELCKHNEAMVEIVRRFPLPQSFEQPAKLIIVPNKYIYYILAVYYHYLPAIVFDGMLRILRKKPRLYSLYRFFDTVMSSVNFFLFYQLKFERKNMDFLDNLAHIENRKDLALDFKDATVFRMALYFPEACPYYDWKIDRKSKSERLKTMKRRHILITSVQGVFLVTCCLFIYWAVSLIFS